MIWVSGTDKGCVWFNRPWLTFTGRSLAQEMGHGWSEGVHRDDFERCTELYTSHFDARKDFRMQYRLRRHDGVYRWIDDTGIPRYARDDDFLGYIGSCVDIHEHREMQSELRRHLLENAELNRQADAAMLAGAIAHEINQPLTAIVANATASRNWLMKSEAARGFERVNDALADIVSDGHRAAEVIQRVRQLVTRSDPKKADLDINEVIHDVVSLMRSELQTHRVEFGMSLARMLPAVLADRVQLQQVIMNLAANAMDAMAKTPGVRIP